MRDGWMFTPLNLGWNAFRGSKVQGSGVQGSRVQGSGFHSRPSAAFGMRIYERRGAMVLCIFHERIDSCALQIGNA